MAITQEDIETLKEIKDKMLELLFDAEQIVRGSGVQFQIDRMKAYWHPHIQMALTKDHFYMGDDGACLEDCIDSLEAHVEDDPDDYIETEVDGETWRIFTSDGLIQKVYDDGEDEWIPGEAEYDALKLKYFADVNL